MNQEISGNAAVIAQPQQASSMLAVIDRAARDTTVDVSKMERLLALAEQIHLRESKSAFDAAMNSAQGEMRPISRDCNNPQTRSRYASYEAIDTAIRPIYTSHGFAMLFGSKASTHQDHVIVTCRVSHRAGHAEHVELDMPADGKGAKGNDVMTKVHARGSALSYAKRYIANLVWNLSFGEADDDGNGAGQRPPPRRDEPPAPKPTTAADVLPKKPTEATRKWMLDGLLDIFEPDQVWGYATDPSVNILKLTETLDQWPLDKVPTSKQALSDLGRSISEFIGPSENPDELPPEIGNVIIHIPPAGVDRATYLKSPDTIASLYARRKEDEAARKRLFGFMSSFNTKGWDSPTGDHVPPSSQDFKLRAALDALAEFRESRNPKESPKLDRSIASSDPRASDPTIEEDYK